MPLTRLQSRGVVAQQVRANARWRRLQTLSEDGITKEDAARLIGITVTGLNSILYRNAKSTSWPIKVAIKDA
jgi:hypothetical protein